MRNGLSNRFRLICNQWHFVWLLLSPFDRVKIDRCFASGECRDSALACTITEIAKHYDMDVITVGVENQPQVDVLVDIGCLFARGFLFGGPQKEEAVMAMLATGQ